MNYIETADDQVANALLSKLENAISALEEYPKRWAIPAELQAKSSEYRQFLSDPFRLIYCVKKNRVEIIMVLQQRQSIQKALTKRISK